MAGKSEDERNGCTIQWTIENISHCRLEFEDYIKSPPFIADAVEGSKWSLCFFPKKYGDDDWSFLDIFVAIWLHREADCSAPEEVTVNIQLAYLDKDGSILKEVTYSKEKFPRGHFLGSRANESRRRVFFTEREAFLPGGTLTLQCTMWNSDERPLKTQNFFARTVFKVNRRSFDLRIDEFSTRRSGLRNNFKDEMIDFDLVINEGVDDEKKLAIEIKSFDEEVKFVSFKTSIVNEEGIVEKNLGTEEYFTDDLKRGIQCMWFLTKEIERYLKNDVLSLNCEYVCSNGAILYHYCSSSLIFLKCTNELVILNDFKQMYSDRNFSDTEIRTPTKTFPAHKNILSARSPVFRRMFSHDMKENNCGNVEITDYDDDTIQRMLLYMYTDSIEDLQHESALQLYMIADKYEIVSLKSRCSSFLKENLCPTNACDALALAELYQDDDLKGDAQAYILFC